MGPSTFCETVHFLKERPVFVKRSSTLPRDRPLSTDRPLSPFWTVHSPPDSILVVRIILNTESPHYFKHCPGRSVRIFLNNKSPHSFKHGPHFFKQVRIFFKHGPHFFKHGPHFFKHGPHFFKQEVRILFKHKVRILVPAHLNYVRFFSRQFMDSYLII